MMEYINNEVEYKKIYDIETLKNYKELVKNMNSNEFDDTSIDNINIYELEDIISKYIDDTYCNNSIYHITPIFFNFLFIIGSFSIYSQFF